MANDLVITTARRISLNLESHVIAVSGAEAGGMLVEGPRRAVFELERRDMTLIPSGLPGPQGEPGPPGPDGADGLGTPEIYVLGSVSGTNTVTATPTPAIPGAYPQGLYGIIFANANTGAVTINGIALKKPGGGTLTGADYTAGVLYMLFHDGTDFRFASAF